MSIKVIDGDLFNTTAPSSAIRSTVRAGWGAVSQSRFVQNTRRRTGSICICAETSLIRSFLGTPSSYTARIRLSSICLPRTDMGMTDTVTQIIRHLPGVCMRLRKMWLLARRLRCRITSAVALLAATGILSTASSTRFLVSSIRLNFGGKRDRNADRP